MPLPGIGGVGDEMDMGMMSLIVECAIPSQMLHRYFEGLAQLRHLTAHHVPPPGGVIEPQPLGVLPPQRDDARPDVAWMLVERLRHMGKRQVCALAGEEAEGARPLGDIIRIGGLNLLHALPGGNIFCVLPGVLTGLYIFEFGDKFGQFYYPPFYVIINKIVKADVVHMKLYQRDYCKKPKESEIAEYNQIQTEETSELPIGRQNLYYKYPEAIRHHNSLFPNNHIDLYDWKASGKMSELTEEFAQLVQNPNTNERKILEFINHRPAQYIIGSLLIHKDFGHHEAYIFPEFSIGGGKYYADYLIVGKNSGGYEFIFVELESPNTRITIKSGYDGQSTRAGLNQIFDWKSSIESNFAALTREFEKASNPENTLPPEFQHYDSTRMHYIVIAGLRTDYNGVTYRTRRSRSKEQGIDQYHYNNLVDFSRELETRSTF